MRVLATVQSRTACDTALETLLARGIPTFAASGDDGARDNDPSHNMGKNADYPAASPYSFGELRSRGHHAASINRLKIAPVAMSPTLRFWMT